MERIALIGLTWRQASREMLERWTVPDAARDEMLPRILDALESDELVYLATCNRVEVAFVTHRDPGLLRSRRVLSDMFAGTASGQRTEDRRVRAWVGEGAVEHWFLLAAGLDSARVGETEVAGQLRRALDRSDDLGLLGRRLAMTGREALKLARRIHRDTAVGSGATSLATVATAYVTERLAQTPGTVALVGVSPMTEWCASVLAKAGTPFLVVNRTLERAEALCERLGAGRAQALSAFVKQPEPVEVVLLATAAPEPVLDRAALERIVARAISGVPPMILDLGLPANVAPEDAAAAGVARIGMDQINAAATRTRERRLRESADARVLVDEALTKFRGQMGEQTIAPMLAALHRRYRHTADEGVERLLRKLTSLDSDQRATLHEWASTLASRFAHIPSRGLRSLAAEWGTSAVETFFRDADDVLMRELGTLLPETRR